MKVYNTLTRSKEEFVTLKPGEVSMYVCGPTVYNLIHIGNARPMVFFDTVRRYLEYKGYKVNYVSNFTDVDDKIIKAANIEGIDASSVAEKYIAECKKDMEGLNIKPATTHPLATREIDGMIDMIEELMEKDFSYVGSDGTVYFRVKKFAGYGKLSHKNLDDLHSGFRTLKVTGEEDKEDPNDFVLWKPMKEGEPYWESPWCKGRPGWHIECSVMSKKYLGEQIDIHGGGEDLVFPHHENEIAQSEAVSGKPFAKYWLHNAFLNINNHKMSKSAGNFFTVRDISEKYDLQVLRFLLLNAHYRSPLNFSDELMDSAKSSLDRIINCMEHLVEVMPNAQDRPLSDEELENLHRHDEYRQKFETAMDDDFNTSDALSFIFEIVRLANASTTNESSKQYVEKIKTDLATLCDIMGFVPERRDAAIDDDIQKLIDQRQQARKDKDFSRADEIRDQLLEMGIILEDTREGVKWKRA